MPAKNEVTKIQRREFVLSEIDRLIKDGICHTVPDARQYIADNKLFCSPSLVYRIATKKDGVQQKLDLFPTNQLNLF